MAYSGSPSSPGMRTRCAVYLVRRGVGVRAGAGGGIGGEGGLRVGVTKGWVSV